MRRRVLAESKQVQPDVLTSGLQVAGSNAQKGSSQKIMRSTTLVAASGWHAVYAHDGSR